MPSDFEILHIWVAETVLPMLKTGGVWAAPDPAPLSGTEVEAAFRIIAAHKNYDGQILMTQHRDGLTQLAAGHIVTIRDSEIVNDIDLDLASSFEGC